MVGRHVDAGRQVPQRHRNHHAQQVVQRHVLGADGYASQLDGHVGRDRRPDERCGCHVRVRARKHLVAIADAVAVDGGIEGVRACRLLREVVEAVPVRVSVLLAR